MFHFFPYYSQVDFLESARMVIRATLRPASSLLSVSSLARFQLSADFVDVSASVVLLADGRVVNLDLAPFGTGSTSSVAKDKRTPWVARLCDVGEEDHDEHPAFSRIGVVGTTLLLARCEDKAVVCAEADLSSVGWPQEDHNTKGASNLQGAGAPAKGAGLVVGVDVPTPTNNKPGKDENVLLLRGPERRVNMPEGVSRAGSSCDVHSFTCAGGAAMVLRFQSTGEDGARDTLVLVRKGQPSLLRTKPCAAIGPCRGAGVDGTAYAAEFYENSGESSHDAAGTTEFAIRDLERNIIVKKERVMLPGPVLTLHAVCGGTAVILQTKSELHVVGLEVGGLRLCGLIGAKRAGVGSFW